METTITSLLDEPDVRGLVLNTRDVTERLRLEEELTHQAYSDALTGLANRSMFRRSVDDALRRSQVVGEVAVVFLDLDGFKSVNDSRGHATGDVLLTHVAVRLRNCVRPGDLIARLGGDEFGVLVIGERAEEGAVWIAQRVAAALQDAFTIEERELHVGCSIGIAVNDGGDEGADQMLRNADLAMYRSKGDSKSTHIRFEADMHRALVQRVQDENDLRTALSEGQLVFTTSPLCAWRAIASLELRHWFAGITRSVAYLRLMHSLTSRSRLGSSIPWAPGCLMKLLGRSGSGSSLVRPLPFAWRSMSRLISSHLSSLTGWLQPWTVKGSLRVR